jgi:hypothetical protein
MTRFIPGLTSMLSTGGYQIAESGGATIDALQRVTGDGVLYIGGHGGEPIGPETMFTP